MTTPSTNNIYDTLLEFVNKNTKTLCEIYINEAGQPRNTDTSGGILLIFYSDTDKSIKTVYVDISQFPDEIITEYENRKSANNENIVYFYICTDEKSSIIELDIRDFCE